MKSYRNFKSEEVSAPVLDHPDLSQDDLDKQLQDYEKQIDDLFDELKKIINNMAQPRHEWLNNLNTWITQTKQQHKLNGLIEYHAINNYLQEFNEALTTDQIDTILDEYKQKFKKIIRQLVISKYSKQAWEKYPNYLAQARLQKIPKKTTPIPPTTPTQAQATPPTTPTQAQATPPTTPTQAQVPTTPIAQTPPTTPTQAQATPAMPQVPKIKTPDEEVDEEKALMKLGNAVNVLKDMHGKMPSPKEVRDGMKRLPFDPDNNMFMKDVLIKIAKEYQILRKPKAQSLLGPNASIAELKVMTPGQFRKWIEHYRHDLVSAYEPAPWWTKKYRKELIDLININRKEHPLQNKVEHYLEMLRKPNRPQILKHEAVKIPLAERVNFYKNKLRLLYK